MRRNDLTDEIRFGSDIEAAVEEREHRVRESVGELLQVIERERAGLNLFGETVEMLGAKREAFIPMHK
jgi:hypothetical protein